MNTTYRIDINALFSLYPYARVILARLNAAGYEAVLIGGVVRDGVRSLLDSSFTFSPQDVDIATSALPDEIRSLFRDRPIVGVGEEFGVLIIVAPDGHEYEVATFRVEEEYDGRWPGKVKLVRDLEEDIRRRDLTINGLAATVDGEVIDLVGGVEDLNSKRIRAIGDPKVRFAEDYLRMLRAVRFACQIHGTIDPETARAIEENAEKIVSISWERVRDELLRILQTDQGAHGLTLLDDYGLLRCILPEVVATKGVPQPEEYHPEGDVFVHTIAAVRVADWFIRDPLVKLAVLLHDIGKPYALERSGGVNMGGHEAVGARMARKIGSRFRLSRHEVARLVFLVKNHMRIADLPKMGRGKQVRFVSEGEDPEGRSMRERYPLFFDLLGVLVADCEACAHRSFGWAPILQETLCVVDHIDRVGSLNKARELIDGHALLAMGIEPGPRLGRILEAVHDRILAGEITTHDQALATARTFFEEQEQERK
ncbi:MAG: CCA tRNA nucleotidyltransferase [Candidatus Bipolaricaulota bacterium]|nr:CCA tRNA nucleotidyltransferase [Candidatus Bipolaricaulota bacterium]